MNNKKDQIAQMIADIDLQPVFIEEETQLEEYQKFPLEQLNALGVAFQSVKNFIDVATSPEVTETLYRKIKPDGYKDTYFKGTKYQTGSIVKKGVQGAKQARWEAVQVNQSPVSFDPTNLCMAIALMSINEKLDDIQETQKEIIEFLEEQEKAKLKGNLNILADILNNYKYNWNNETYKSHKHIQVQEIKRDAEQSLIFHRGVIEKILKKTSFLHSDGNVNEKIKKTENGYKDYQLSLYLYAFSAFFGSYVFGKFRRRLSRKRYQKN